MSDDTTIPGPEDTRSVNRNQRWELDYWSKKLGCSVEQLKTIIDQVGPKVKDIEKALGK